MGIEINDINKKFHLFTKNTSYLIEIVGQGHLSHSYWGKRIHTPDKAAYSQLQGAPSFSPNVDKGDALLSLDTLPREYPDYGRGDYQSPAIEVILDDGSHIINPVYMSRQLLLGKPSINGLPSVYVLDEDNADTLEIVLKDQHCGLVIKLYYHVLFDYDVITRRVVIENESEKRILLTKVLSGNVDFLLDNDFELIHLEGSWGRERHLTRNKVIKGAMVVESRRGASSHQNNPFVALARPDTTESSGEVYGMNLVYSGSFIAQIEVTPYDTTRLQMGLNPIDFTWNLEAKTEFSTPEVVMVYSDQGLNGMSLIYHHLYRERLCRGQHQYAQRPVLINNWEATYFDFDEDKLKKIIDASAPLGIELFVLDDGWFGERNSDMSGLGDWKVNYSKLTHGLSSLAEYANAQGMKFGLWFEPEMVSPVSELYAVNPDWCLHVTGRSRTTGRNQLILDLSREDVQDYIIKSLSVILESANIEYVKWDMNRNMTEVGSAKLAKDQQKETSHRYIVGLYRVLEIITTKFPKVLFESCSGGGGRFDPGMLHYMPQTWTSDNSDAYERQLIQWGTSLAYPPVTMAAHVSVVPNHQVARITPLQTRGHVAMSANFGYELDMTALTDEEQGQVKEQVNFYKTIRQTIQYGDFYRIKSPFDSEECVWQFISADKDEVILGYFRRLQRANTGRKRLKLFNLEPDRLYQVGEEKYYGDTLMHFGIELPPTFGDFTSQLIVLKKL